MENLYIHLSSNFDTIYKIVESSKTLMSVNSIESLNKIIDLELTNPSNFEIYIYPITKKETSLFSYSAKFKIENEKLICENNYVIVYNLPENHYFINFLPLSDTKQEISGDKLEFNDTQIKKLSYLNDLAGRAKVEVLKIDDKKINKEKEYYVYLDDNIEAETNPDLILLAFFEAYISKDYNTCFSYLSENYASSLNKESLKEFFGDCSSCMLINFYSYPSVILFYNNHASVYSANIKNDKIFDIYEIN